jgi:predicted tellurium resistance membrane protein TerC
MPILAPLIAWIAELSFFEALTVGTLGFFGIKLVSNEVKSTVKEAVIPAALIFGVIYWMVSRRKN